MSITIGKKLKHHHDILVVTDTKKIDPRLSVFVQETLKLTGNDMYTIGVLPQTQKQHIHYTIVLHIKNAQIFADCGEAMIAEMVGYIKKLDKDFFIDLDASGLAQDDIKLFAELALTGLYSFAKYKKSLETHYSLTVQSKYIDAKHFACLAHTFALTKNLVNDPSQSVNPLSFEQEVHKLFATEKNITISVFDAKKLVKKGMMGIYEVGKGSENPPRLVLIEYRGTSKKGYDVGLVGKGVCFDSGGYNLKTSGGGIETMKLDMAGGATVLGLLYYAVKTGLKKNIVVGIPMVENLVSHNAYKPGEVIRMYNGKTVEVGNTDAEGRLILADTLAYMEEQYKPRYMFDFATLTGAQLIATGSSITAILGRNSTLNQELQARSFALKDRVRELPFFEPYFKTYNSPIADMNNMNTSGTMGPGTITAGLFLSQFVRMTNRVHFDIAGPAFKNNDPLTGYGATGCMLRLMIDFLAR